MASRITGVYPSCGTLTKFEYCGEVHDDEGWTVTLYTCLSCGTTRSKRAIVAATLGLEQNHELEKHR